MRTLRRAMVGVLWLAAAGCRTAPPAPAPAPPAAPEERSAMQSHRYADPIDAVFASTIEVLQDLGWNLDQVDRAAGIVRASTGRRREPIGPEEEQAQRSLAGRLELVRERSSPPYQWTRWQELIIHIEPWGAGTRQRIVMNLRGTLPAMSYRAKQGGGLFGGGREVMINAPPEEQRVEVLVPEAYEDLFQRIEKAAAERRNL